MGGFEVLNAASGAGGIETARTERPDAILLDWMMPDMDGPATFEALQLETHTRDIPVLMLTAKVQASDRQRLVDLGVAGVLSKPFEPMQLPDQAPSEARSLAAERVRVLRGQLDRHPAGAGETPAAGSSAPGAEGPSGPDQAEGRVALGRTRRGGWF